MSCNKCGKEYSSWRWCKPCQIDNLKGNFTKWTSKNKKIDKLIQEIQLKIDDANDIVFEWILYDQFSDIKEIGKGDFTTVYSAIWKGGPLGFDESAGNFVKSSPYQKVFLKCLHNTPKKISFFKKKSDVTNDFLDEV